MKIPKGVIINTPEGTQPQVKAKGVPAGVKINVPGGTPNPIPTSVNQDVLHPIPDPNKPKSYIERVHEDMLKRGRKSMEIMERSITDPKYGPTPIAGHLPRMGAITLGTINAAGQGAMGLIADPIAEAFVSGWNALAPEEFKKFLSEDIPDFLLGQATDATVSIMNQMGLSPQDMTPDQAKKYKEFIKSDIGKMAVDAMSKGLGSWKKFDKKFPEFAETFESILGFQTANIIKVVSKEAGLAISDGFNLAKKVGKKTMQRDMKDLFAGASEEYINSQKALISESIRTNIPKVINLAGEGKKTMKQKMAYLDKAEGAINDIILNKDNIILHDLTGKILPHKLPTNTDTAFMDMIQSIDQTKRTLWPQVESALEAADKTGIMIKVDNVIKEISSFIESPSIVSRPDARSLREAGHKMLDYYENLKEAKPSWIYQNIIKDRNKLLEDMKAFLQVSISDTEKAGLFAAELRGLNSSFKEILNESGNEALERYGNLLTIQGDFENLIKTSIGVSGVDYATVFTLLETAKLATTGIHSPSTLGMTRAINKAFRRLPEQNITRMFKTTDNILNKKIIPPSPVNPKSFTGKMLGSEKGLNIEVGKSFEDKMKDFDSLL